MSSSSSGNVGFWSIKSFRLYLTLIFGLAVLANALIRNTLSMAMVCMVNKTAVQELNEILNTSEMKSWIPIENSSCQAVTVLKSEYEGTFVWNSKEQGFLFSALFIGGLISVLPSGLLSDKYSPKFMVLIGLMCSTVGCYLTPVTALRGDYVAVFVLRFIMGLFGEAIIITGILSVSARWIPPTERSTVLALYTAGNQLANIIGMPMNAFLCGSKHFLGGWPSIFYVNATFGIVASILWIIFVTNRPDTNRFISEKEKEYITKSLADQNVGKRKHIFKNVPWKDIFTSPVLITCFISNLTSQFLMTSLMAYLPTYFKEALFLDLKSNGLFSALPYISQWISKMVFAVIADWMKKKTTISHTLIGKVFNTIGTFGTSIFLIAVAYLDCTNVPFAVACLTLSNTMFSGIIPGWATSLLAVAPAYTGIINSMGRFAGQLGSVLAPYVISLILVESTIYEWRTVFFVIAAIMVFSGILFIIFGSAELQEWAKAPSTDDEMVNRELINLSHAIVTLD